MKPKIICHIMSSVDGRLLNERWTPLYDGTPFGEAGKVYAEAGRALHTQAWMFGKNTLQQEIGRASCRERVYVLV